MLSPIHRKNIFTEWSCQITSSEKDIAIQYIQEKCPSLISKLWKFQKNKDPDPFNKTTFGKVSASISMTDFEWWEAFVDTFPEILHDEEKSLIFQLSTATASSADLERMFS